MQVIHKEPCRTNINDEIRLGISSWDEGAKTARSVKYTWFDKRGYACRGGEVPVEALPQMVELAIKYGYLTKGDFKKEVK